MLFELECFKYDMSIYLNMGCYHIQISENASNLCRIILPWVKYGYKRLPTGVRNSPDVFQQKFDEFFQGFGCIHEYIYDLFLS